MGIKKYYTNNIYYIFVCCMLSFFCILKVLRGSSVESTQVGGIWNYISLLYYPLFIYSVIKTRFFKLDFKFIFPFLFSVGAVISIFANNSSTLTQSLLYYILMVPYFFLVFATFYLSYREDTKCANRIILLTYILCLFINLFTISRHQFFGASRPMASDIYYSLGLFPFALLLEEKKQYKNFYTILQFLVIFLADKRTGILAFLLAYIIYLMIENQRMVSKNLKKLFTVFFTLVITSCVLYTLTKHIDTSFQLNIYNRILRLGEDGGSGRGHIYTIVWNAYLNSDIRQQLFGHGINAAGKICGSSYVHNDFLEVLYDYGAINFIPFILFYGAMITHCIGMIIKKSPYAGVYAFSLVVGIFLSLFSFFLIYYTYVTCIVAFWGVVLSKEKKRTLFIKE